VTCTLLVGFYRDAVATRMGELLTCLERNAANALFDAVHVFVEDKRVRRAQVLRDFPILSHPKIRLIDHGQRVSYRDLFDYASCALAGKRIVVANADIYFDATLALLDGVDLDGKLLCLSRWDVHDDGSAHLFAHTYSQDAWIFQAPIRSFRSDFRMGLPRCDNRIAWEAQRAGLAVSNPSCSIRAHHLHASGVRNYVQQQEIRGDGLGIPVTELEQGR